MITIPLRNNFNLETVKYIMYSAQTSTILVILLLLLHVLRRIARKIFCGVRIVNSKK